MKYEEFAKELARRVTEFLAMNPTMRRDDPLLATYINSQICCIKQEFEEDKAWATAYLSSKSCASREHVLIDICVPREPFWLEQIEGYFDLARRRLRRQIESERAIANPVEDISP